MHGEADIGRRHEAEDQDRRQDRELDRRYAAVVSACGCSLAELNT
jgi:hypothetical protein